MTLSPVSSVLKNAPDLKPISNLESPKPLHFDFLDFIPKPLPSSFEGVLKKGSHVFNLTIHGNLIETKRLIPFKTTQDIFFALVDNHLLFSLDQDKWKSFDEIFSWNIALDLPVNSEGLLDDFSIHCECNMAKAKGNK